MIIPNQVFTTKWSPANINHYKNLGYKFTKYGDTITVPVEHLPRRSCIKVKAICDYCNKEYEVALSNYNNNIRLSRKVACRKCRKINSNVTMMEKYNSVSPMKADGALEKAKQTNLIKYGAENPMQNKEVQNKQRNTMMNRYDVEYALQNNSFKEKAQKTSEERYGVPYPTQSEVIKDLIAQNNLSKYGVKNTSQLPSVIAKMKETNKGRYGGESSQCLSIVREKTYNTLKDKDGLLTSKPERETVSLLMDIFGEDNCNPQFFFDRLVFDCLLTVDETLIDVEYDGRYWHELHPDRDIRRDNFVIKQGIKIFRIISDVQIPTKEQIIEGMNYLLNSEHYIYKLYI